MKAAVKKLQEKVAECGWSEEKEKQVDVEAVEVMYIGPEGNEETPPPQFTPEEEKRVYRKIDMRLLPILTIMYLASFLDRGMSHATEKISR